MRKSFKIAVFIIAILLIVAASTLAFLNINKFHGNSGLPAPTPTQTATPTSTVEPTQTAVPTQFTPSPTPTPSVTNYGYTIVNTYPHDTGAFTEGLVYSNGFLYESTGLEGQSTLRKVDLNSGGVLQQYSLPAQYFGEGIAIVNNIIIQLTWQSHIGFIYDKNTFALLGNFTYATAGWGLTYDENQLIMSDGTDNLYFLNTTTFQRTGQIQVHDGNASVVNINELEYVNGDVYANIWETNKIAVINPENGQVKAWIDLTGLPAPTSNGDNVLNGIAYDQQNSRLFVTGKEWPNLYQIKFIPQN
jgi:glutaminyl-peptide cyclotransferase